MAMTIQQQTDAYRFFAIAFGAAPGVTYMNQIADAYAAGMTTKQIVNVYTTKPQFTSVYSNFYTNAQFANALIENVVGTSASAAAKAQAKADVEAALNIGWTRGDVIYQIFTNLANKPLTDPDWGNTAKLLANQVAVARYYTEVKLGDTTDLAVLKSVIAGVTPTTDVSTPAALDAVLAGVATGQTFTLTNGTDVATANVFNAGLVYNPGGTDRINALQSEDTLTGTGTNPTLNATLGNANDNGATTVTPKLRGIETINLEITGDTNTLDLRNADATKAISINRITAEAGNNVNIDNIGTLASELAVRNTSKVLVDVAFNYTDGVLIGTRAGGNAETGNVALAAANIDVLHVGNNANTEGFEKLNLDAQNGVVVQQLEAIDLENLTITGSGNLTIATLQKTDENTVLQNGGIDIGDGIGVRSVDASAFKGNLTLDITNLVGGHVDPADSGNPFWATITGGQGNDTFWSAQGLTAKDALDGGAGTNRLILTDGDITKAVTIKNIQALELRNQTVSTDAHTIDLRAFDGALASVLMRDEDSDGFPVDFTLNYATAALAGKEGGLVLRHSVTEGAVLPTNANVNVRLADASGANDTVVLRVENDLNKETVFNYMLDFDGASSASDATLVGGKVENVTIIDADTESNTVALVKTTEHTGTVTLSGGKAGQTYTVSSQLYAATVDAEKQASDLRLTVGNNPDASALNQTIKLGTGNDILTFTDIDSLDGNDTITDAGGTDTVRAAFSKDPAGTINLTGVEKFHIVATNNVTIDMAKASTVSELALLSDNAVDGDSDKSPITAEPFNLAGVQTTDIITLKNTALSTLNFFADNDTDDTANNESLNHTFNGVTLSNNSVDTLAVVVNSSLDVDKGATSYAIGQITAHGVKTMSVNIGDELPIAAGATASTTVTTINNIYAKDLQTFTAKANGSLNLGTVSGNVLGNNLTSFDVSAVKGDFKADVVALGNNAVVNLAQGENIFSALGSAGNNVTINGNSRNDTITGTAQSDIINAGTGNDTVDGDRGNNTLNLGAGDDIANAADGSNIIAFGTGTYESANLNKGTKLDASKSTNVFTLEGTEANVWIDVNGDGTQDIDQNLAVGNGSALRVSYNGGTLQLANALLDGAKANNTALLSVTTVNGDANSNLFISNTVTIFNGGAGNDVLIQTVGVTTAVTFNGGTGNDAFVGDGGKAHDITGGTGADRIVLGIAFADADTAGSTIHIADGDSTVSGWDQIYGFGATKTSLDLVFTTYAANTTGTDGTNAGTIKSHAITNGVVTFDDVDTFATALTINQSNLADVLQYLATNLNGTSLTVAFAYDRTGDGTADDMFVFQDGMTDTVVQLVGTAAIVNATTGIVLS